jgi:menaquinone-9 beta-reductase
LSEFATIDVAEAIHTPWDAIVIGAGPAGTAAAYLLAKRGLSTLLVERHSWPRQKVCGGCLNAGAASALDAIGLHAVLQKSSATPLERFSIHADCRNASVSVDGGCAVDRTAFDAALACAAVSAGAHFLPATRAVVEPLCSESVRPQSARLRIDPPAANRSVLLVSDNRSGTATARVVVAADGLGHPSLKRLAEFQSKPEPTARLGLSLVIPRLASRYEAGVVYMAVAPQGYVGLVRTQCGNGNLAAAIDAHAIRTAKTPEATVAKILLSAGLEVPDLANGQRWLGTLPLSRRPNRLLAQRMVLVGDAAGYIEPFTGEGIGWALQSAVSSVVPTVENLEAWDMRCIAGWEQAERRRMARGQIICRMLSGLLHRPRAVQLALAVLAVAPALATPLVRKVCRPKSKANFQVS